MGVFCKRCISRRVLFLAVLGITYTEGRQLSVDNQHTLPLAIKGCQSRAKSEADIRTCASIVDVL